MDSGLAFAGFIVAQVLAVIAVHGATWHGGTPMPSDSLDKALRDRTEGRESRPLSSPTELSPIVCCVGSVR